MKRRVEIIAKGNGVVLTTGAPGNWDIRKPDGTFIGLMDNDPSFAGHLILLASFPDTVLTALIGRPLSDLVDLTGALVDPAVPIRSLEPSTPELDAANGRGHVHVNMERELELLQEGVTGREFMLVDG